MPFLLWHIHWATLGLLLNNPLLLKYLQCGNCRHLARKKFLNWPRNCYFLVLWSSGKYMPIIFLVDSAPQAIILTVWNSPSCYCFLLINNHNLGKYLIFLTTLKHRSVTLDFWTIPISTINLVNSKMFIHFRRILEWSHCLGHGCGHKEHAVNLPTASLLWIFHELHYIITPFTLLPNCLVVCIITKRQKILFVT